MGEHHRYTITRQRALVNSEPSAVADTDTYNFLWAFVTNDVDALQKALSSPPPPPGIRVMVCNVLYQALCLHAPCLDSAVILVRHGILPVDYLMRVLIGLKRRRDGLFRELGDYIAEHVHPAVATELVCNALARHNRSFFADAAMTKSIHVVEAAAAAAVTEPLHYKKEWPRTRVVITSGVNKARCSSEWRRPMTVTFGTDNRGWLPAVHPKTTPSVLSFAGCSVAVRVAPWSTARTTVTTAFLPVPADTQHYDLPVFDISAVNPNWQPAATRAAANAGGTPKVLMWLHVNGVRARKFMIKESFTDVEVAVRKGGLAYVTRFRRCQVGGDGNGVTQWTVVQEE